MDVWVRRMGRLPLLLIAVLAVLGMELDILANPYSSALVFDQLASALSPEDDEPVGPRDHDGLDPSAADVTAPGAGPSGAGRVHCVERAPALDPVLPIDETVALWRKVGVPPAPPSAAAASLPLCLTLPRLALPPFDRPSAGVHLLSLVCRFLI